MSDQPRRVSTSRLGRILSLGVGGARSGARLLLGGTSSAAEEATALLGQLRGLAAKAGQIASYVDGVIPEEHRETFERTFGKLRDHAPASPPAEIFRLLEAELGRPHSELFAELEEHPFASASIGQVHRARLSDGRQVAVKIQHPGIDEAVRADLDNATVIEALLGNLGGRKVGSREAVSEIRARFLEEIDYRLEAARQREFAALFKGDPRIRVPAIIDELSSERVLTSELADGLSLDEAAAEEEPHRHAWAETLWRFVFTGVLVGAKFNADPHPGNYFFQPEGRITFLDFGCVQTLDEHHLEYARLLHRAAAAHDERAFYTAARGLLRTRPGPYEDWALEFSRQCFEPLFSSPFRMTRGYTISLVESMKRMKREIMFARDSGFTPLPPGMLFMNRLQFGFYSILSRLDVEVDYAALERPILARL